MTVSKYSSSEFSIPYWQQMLNELLSLPGVNISTIARELGSTRVTVRKLVSGATKEPRNTLFKSIVQYYFSHCYDESGHKQVPLQ